MIQDFKILWVEDNLLAVEKQIEGIKSYLEKKYFNPEINTEKNLEKIKQAIKDEDMDIVVTDLNLEKFNGWKVIEEIRSNRKLTDVLLYTTIGGLGQESINKFKNSDRHYEFVLIVRGKEEIEENLKELIDKNIKRSNDVVFLRGKIIDRFIEIELKLDKFLYTYFMKAKKKQESFRDALESEHFSVNGKIRILGNILDKENSKEKIVNKLEKCANYRNLLAHSKKREDVLIVKIKGKERDFDRKELYRVLKDMEVVEDTIEGLNFKKSNKSKT